MPKTAAKIKQADVARVLRAAKQVGMAVSIEIRPDGTVAFLSVDKANLADSYNPQRQTARPVM